MPLLEIQLTYDPGKLITRSVGINLESLPIAGNHAQATIDAERTYYFTCHFVVNTKATPIHCQLIPPAGFRVRFTDFPTDLSSAVTWTAGVANRDYFKFRRFFLEVIS